MCVYKTFKGGCGRIFDMWQGDLLLIQMTILINREDNESKEIVIHQKRIDEGMYESS